MPGRLVQSAAVSDEWEVDVLYHPDRPNEPGTGAIQSMVVDLEDWHPLPAMRILLVVVQAYSSEIPSITDCLYPTMYGPYWLKALIEVSTAAYMMGLLEEARIEGVIRYVAEPEQHELRQAIAAAHRLGVPPIEVYMIVHERL